MRMLPSSSLTVPDVQLSRFRFFMEEFRSRRCSDGQSGLPAEGDVFNMQSWSFSSVCFLQYCREGHRRGGGPLRLPGAFPAQVDELCQKKSLPNRRCPIRL